MVISRKRRLNNKKHRRFIWVKRKENSSRQKKLRLLLLALMAAQQTCANMPHITVSQNKMFKVKLSKYKKQGNLMTAALPDKVLTDLRMALEALPEDSQALQGSLNIILIQGVHM